MSDYPEPINNDDLAIEIDRPKLKRPPMYRVLLLNDDYTTMEFVVLVLTTIFNHSEEKATEIMLSVHQKGAGICGIYTREVAESKVDQVRQLSEQRQHPLQCTMEPDNENDE